VEDGWVEWFECPTFGDKCKYKNIRLVHHPAIAPCNQVDEKKYKGCVFDNHLKYFLGLNGLMLLLCMIEEKWSPAEQLTELIKRIHIPGYEDIRQDIQKAYQEDILQPDIGNNYVMQEDITAIKEWRARKLDPL